ncbi:MAG: hypothetical protein IH616_05465 [Gemmatimonadales bacterium]|nr:hypothetical protein [Gemmatimonadales bacterium]
MVRIPRASIILLALGCLSLTGRPLVAQGAVSLRNSSRVGVGYVANIPNTFLGFSVLALTDKLFGGAGLYADFKTTTTDHRSDPDYLAGVTIAYAELAYADQLYTEESEWLSVDVALVYAVTNDLAIYGGAGYTRERHFRQYYDDSVPPERGEFGFYWIDDPEASGNRVNVLGGVLFRLTKYVLFQLGGDMQPPGVSVGVVLTLPF